MHTSFPYPRDVWAMVCDRLFNAGAKVVALDVWFPGPSPNDAAWKSAIDRYADKIVIATNFSNDRVPPTNSDAYSLSIPSVSLFPEQTPFDPRFGYVNYWTDSDDVVRDAQYVTNTEQLNHNAGADSFPKVYSFAARAVEKGGHPELVPKDMAARTMRLAGPPLLPFKNYSLYQIFDPQAWENNFKNGDFFRDKIVVVGPQGDFAKDKSSTAYGQMDGSEIHLNAINALLQNEFLTRSSGAFTLLTIIVAALLALTLALLLVEIAWRFLAVVVVVGGYTLAQIAAYNGPGWLLPAVGPIGLFCAATATGFIYDFVLNQIEKLRQRSTFERYYSKNVVKHLLDNTTSYKQMLVGSRCPVTVLFSDIRSFTTIVETTSDSQKLVDKLNEYFTAMVDCVYKYDGSLDKFMGDGIMAIWGNTPYNFGAQGDAVRAVRSALAMLEQLRLLNAKWVSEGKTEWKIGIGLNHGQVIVGDMGSQQRKEYGVIGDAVNLGARLESLTKVYHLQILIGESVAELVRDQFYLRNVDFIRVKGKTQPIRAFTVLGEKNNPLPPEKLKFLSLYEEGISSFRQREFVRAKGLFELALQLQPDDFLANDYLKDCDRLILNPPGEEWMGVRVMTEK
jgi:adenylate cyclase